MKLLTLTIVSAVIIPLFGQAQTVSQPELTKQSVMAQAASLQARYNQLTGASSKIDFAGIKNSFDLADTLGVMSSNALTYSFKSGGSVSTSEKMELLKLQIKLDRLTADVRAYGVERVFADGNFSK